MTIKKFISEFWYFGLKQAYASIFGIYLILIMLITSYWYPVESIHRYDFIFIAAIIFQVFLLVTKLETLKESLVIITFHIVATIMEIFKTSDAIGAWSYPEEYFFGIANVPLFTGFMYSAVGSYIARVWRIFNFRYSYYPPKIGSLILAVLIYVNFFTHHFFVDLRWGLLAFTVLLFYKTDIYFFVTKTHRRMPLLLGWFLVALFIWFAENIATYANIWVYPNQKIHWQLVSISKISSWYLLMILSFVLVTLINTISLTEHKKA